MKKAEKIGVWTAAIGAIAIAVTVAIAVIPAIKASGSQARSIEVLQAIKPRCDSDHDAVISVVAEVRFIKDKQEEMHEEQSTVNAEQRAFNREQSKVMSEIREILRSYE